MLLSKHTAVRLRPAEANFIGHMCYAAYKLWNVCNYERIHYQELGLTRYPDWYYQKSAHKGDLWYKSLPSQSAQEVLKLLDKSWKSYYALKKSGGVLHPHHPYFKKEGIVVTYMQNGIVHRPDEPLEGALQLRTLWLFPKGKSHKNGEWRVTRPDTDNLQKLLKDCMTRCGFWQDDAQVVREIVEKRWSDEPTGIYIEIEELEVPHGK